MYVWEKMENGDGRCCTLDAWYWIVTSFGRKLSSADLLKADSNESWATENDDWNDITVRERIVHKYKLKRAYKSLRPKLAWTTTKTMQNRMCKIRERKYNGIYMAHANQIKSERAIVITMKNHYSVNLLWAISQMPPTKRNGESASESEWAHLGKFVNCFCARPAAAPSAAFCALHALFGAMLWPLSLFTLTHSHFPSHSLAVCALRVPLLLL